MAIDVLVVHSHSGGDRVWGHLNNNWRHYGPTEIRLTVASDLTNDLLQLRNPDVIVCGDTAGAPYQFSTDEFEAIERYLLDGVGHHLLGTYALFFHEEGQDHRRRHYDNRRLAPLFGIDPALALTTQRLAGKPQFRVADPSSLLWKNIPILYKSNGYESTQLPVSRRWLPEMFPAQGVESTTTVLARTEDDRCVVVNHIEPRFSSLYISTMPEYESLTNTFVDCQFLYNAFCFLVNQNVNISLTNRCLDCLSKSNVKYLMQKIPFPLRDNFISQRFQSEP